MKKIIISTLLAGATLMAADSAPMYKSGILLPANGEAIYKSTCLECHGADGKQTTMESSTRVVYAPINGRDAASLAKELKDYRLGTHTAQGNKYGYGALMKSTLIDLSYEEIDALAKYISENIK